MAFNSRYWPASDQFGRKVLGRLNNGQCFLRLVKKSRMVMKFDPYGTDVDDSSRQLYFDCVSFAGVVRINCL